MPTAADYLIQMAAMVNSAAASASGLGSALTVVNDLKTQTVNAAAVAADGATGATEAKVTATTASALAQGYAAMANILAAPMRRDLDIVTYDREQSLITRPNLVLSANYHCYGDSTAFGVGSPLSFPAQLTAMVTSGGTIVNSGVGGTTSAQTLTTYGAASATVKGQNLFLFTGLNDLGVLNDRQWATVTTKANVTAIKALQTGGAKCAIFLPGPVDVAGAEGSRYAADAEYYAREMRAAFGADVIDYRRYMITKGGTRNGPDLYQTRVLRQRPLTRFGSNAVSDVIQNNAPPLTNAGAPTGILTYDDGRIVWDSVNRTWYRHHGANGAGSTLTADPKHPSQSGYGDIAELGRDWAHAVEGTGAPFTPPGYKFRAALDIAAGGLVGTLGMRGTAIRAAIVAGNWDGVFTIDPSGNIYRSNTGALAPLIYTLYVKLTAANGFSRIEAVDIYIGRPSTQTTPVKMNIGATGFSMYGMEDHGVPDSDVLSFAFWVKVDNLASAPYLASWTVGKTGSQAKMTIQISAGGLLKMTANDAANQLVLNATSKAVAFGGTALVQGQWTWVCGAYDQTNGTIVGYFNDTPLSFSGTGSAYTHVAGTVPFSDMSPLFLTTQEPRGLNRTGVGTLIGGFGFGAIWTDYHDWAVQARRRELFDATFNATIASTTATLNSHAAKMVIQGYPADVMFGGDNPRIILTQMTANDLLTLA